jgi:hypothetical protein
LCASGIASKEIIVLLLARKHRGRLLAGLELLLCAILLPGGSISPPAAAIGGSQSVYLPLVRTVG